jgi:hypothetical protein
VPSELSTLIDLLARSEFWASVLIGALGFGVFSILKQPQGLPGWGLALSAASLIGINLVFDQLLTMTIGVGILGVGGWSLDRTLESGGKPLSPLVTWLVIGAGALMVSLGRGLPDGHWMLVVTPVIIIGAGFILRYWIDSPIRHLLGPLLQ